MAAALRTIWLVLCSLALCRCAPGLDRQRTLAEYLHTAWTADEGAPDDIWAIAQTHDGYLWLAAQQGLFRFDGVHFEQYEPREGQLASQQLSTLFATPDGGLWIGFRLGRASFLKDGQITNYGAKEGLPHRRYSCVMRPLRYSINVTLDGCCDHRAMFADEDLHRHAAENLDQADALLFGRVTYEMMEAAFRPPAPTGASPDWMEPFGRTVDAAKKYVVSSTLDRVHWNAELVRGDLGKAIQQLKRESCKGLLAGGVKLPLALAELGLIESLTLRVA